MLIDEDAGEYPSKDLLRLIPILIYVDCQNYGKVAQEEKRGCNMRKWS
jgi:hypothetical protein